MAELISGWQHRPLKKNILLLMSLAFFSSCFIFPGSVIACGGPATYELDTPMHSLDSLMEQFLTTQIDYEMTTRDEFLFLYPFKLKKPAEIEPLWQLEYANNPNMFPQPVLTGFESAVMQSDWKNAESAARKIVNEVLDMPAMMADEYQSSLIKGLEFLELLPFLKNNDPQAVKSAFWDSSVTVDSSKLSQDLQDILAIRKLDRQKVDDIIAAKPHHPRIATLRFISLRNEFARKVPDGWAYAIRKNVPKETWRELERSADQWLKDYPQHPLVDLVLLWKTRIYYFEGSYQLAWNQLLSIYPRRLPRVLYEMRYMLMYASPPYDNIDKIEDPILFTALLPSIYLNQEQWSKWWKISLENSSHKWAINLQERLLEKSIHGVPASTLPPVFPKSRPRRYRSGNQSGESTTVPPSFPNEPGNPTTLWGKLRALSLMKSCQWDAAAKQLFSLAPDKEQAILAAAYHLRRDKASLAAQVIDLPEDIRHYLIRVILDDEGLNRLQTAKNATIRKEALFEQGVRLAAKGKWIEAASIIRTTGNTKSILWDKAARLSPDNSAAGRLRWARFLKENNGKLMYGNDSAWYRSLNWRIRRISYNQQPIVKRAKQDTHQKDSTIGAAEAHVCSQEVPWTEQQDQTAITRHITRTAELWLALQAYAEWLSTAKPSREMSAVIKEADVCYNWLVNWDSSNSNFWKDYLADQAAIQQIREAGKRARNR